MGRKKEPPPPTAEEMGYLGKALRRALYGRYEGTSGELTCDIVRLDNDRHELIQGLVESAKSVRLMGTRKAKQWLESWFETVRLENGELPWGDHPQDVVTAVQGELSFRREVGIFYERVKQMNAQLLQRTRKALLESDKAYFRDLVGMMDLLITWAPMRPSSRVASPAHVVGMIAVGEWVARRERSIKAGGEKTSPGGFLGQSIPYQSEMTLAQIRAKFVHMTGTESKDTAGLDRSLRRWCKEVGYVPKKAPKGPPKKKQTAKKIRRPR